MLRKFSWKMKGELPEGTVNVSFIEEGAKAVFQCKIGHFHFDRSDKTLLVCIGKDEGKKYVKHEVALQNLENRFDQVIESLMQAISNYGINRINCLLKEEDAKNFLDAFYNSARSRFHNSFKKQDEDNAKDFPLEDVNFLEIIEGKDINPELTFKEANLRGYEVFQKAAEFADDLTNLPANICTIDHMREEARKVFDSLPADKVSWEEIRGQSLLEKGLNCLHAVGRGSSQEPSLISISYRGHPVDKYISFVGKGLVYDTGGLDIKIQNSMRGMHADMAGAAIVLSLLQAVEKLKMPVNITVTLCLAENSVGPDSFRSGDVIKAHNGKTICIQDTDAEGRLVLADGLSYVDGKYDPSAIVNIATLTGTDYTLGADYAGLFTNCEDLYAGFISAALECRSGIWPLPLTKRYKSKMHGSNADLDNVIVNRSVGMGHMQGALFLESFVTKPWAHLDISGLKGSISNSRNTVYTTLKFLKNKAF